MNDRQTLRLNRVGRRITRQLPDHLQLPVEFNCQASFSELARCFLGVHSHASVVIEDIRQNPSQVALTHLVKDRLIAALYNIQGYAEEQIRELEKVK